MAFNFFKVFFFKCGAYHLIILVSFYFDYKELVADHLKVKFFPIKDYDDSNMKIKNYFSNIWIETVSIIVSVGCHTKVDGPKGSFQWPKLYFIMCLLRGGFFCKFLHIGIQSIFKNSWDPLPPLKIKLIQ